MPEIPSTPADGNTRVLWVPAIANTAAPTVAELTAGSVVDISCYLTSDGFTPSLSEQVITDERLCSTQIFEQPGRSTDSLDVIYIDNTNSANAATYNKAADTLTKGAAGFVVVRRGIPYENAIAAAQKVTVFPATAMVQNELPPEANSVNKIGQKLAITGEVKRRVAVAA